ncbi:MAG: ATP synthase F1 subunit gamma [Bacteroidetes bacterium]|nr:MAG: ATP synthase F1 subunit gamma [Bacteroidota bacterium]
MANLKEVRDRIQSVINTQQITKAMKMVSASKLRKAQDAIVQMRPYADKLNEMLRNILSNLEGDVDTSFGEERPIQRAAIVVITSNRGLCGAFNANVIKEAVNVIDTKYAEVRNAGYLDIIPIGKKGFEFFSKSEYKDCRIVDDYVELFENLSYDNVAVVSKRIMSCFSRGLYDNVTVAYGRFKNAAVQTPIAEQFLPVAKIEKTEGEEGNGNMKADYIFEPDKKGLLDHLVPSIIQTQFQKFVLDTHASEHGARMTAMDAATENAQELLKELRLSYNKARQEAITNEILEIVSGAAALASG